MKKSMFRELHKIATEEEIIKMADDALEITELEEPKGAKNNKKGSVKKNDRKYDI